MVEFDSGFNDEQKKRAKVLKVTCNLNNAACKLKLKDNKEAVKLATKVSKCVVYSVISLAYMHVVFFVGERDADR